MPGPPDLSAFHWTPAAGGDPVRLARLVERAAQQLQDASVRDLRSGRRKRLYPLCLLGGDAPDHLLKLNAYRGAGPWQRLRRSKSRRELARSERVAAAGVPTPVPLGAGEQRRAGWLETCALLVPRVPHALDLRQLLRGGPPPARERRALALALGRLVRALLAAGVEQDDLTPNNVLVVPGDPPALLAIDFERARLRRRVGPRAQRRMLAKLERALPAARPSDRMRFLLALTGGDRAAARALWHALEEEAPRLARRDARRVLRNLRPGGRRFRPLAIGAWRGVASARVEPPRLEAALAHHGPAPERPEAGLLAVPAPPGAAARRAFATGWVLAERGLAARPVALARRGEVGLLLLEADGARADDAPADSAGLRRFLDRLLLFAAPRAPADPALILCRGGAPGDWQLLDPAAVRLRDAPERRRAAHAAAWAATLAAASRAHRKAP